ncbi:MAG: hypothetical protein V4736_01095 [Bdellovibrionota bacterium]
MKTLTVIAVSVLMSSFANANTKYVCREIEGDKQTVVLTLDEKKPVLDIKEGVKYKYTLALYRTNTYSPDLEVKGTVETEDVMFDFTSNDKRVSFSIFMDEMDQSNLSIRGEESSQFVCY